MERPEHRRRSSRRNLQKSDPSDAERAARTVLAGEASGVPKSGVGNVEMIRALRAARRSAIKARTGRRPAPGFARDGAGATAPPFAQTLDEGTRFGGRALPPRRRPPRRAIGHQVRAPFGGPPLRGPSEEIAGLESHLDRLVAQAAPELVALPGIGTENAATLWIVALKTTLRG